MIRRETRREEQKFAWALDDGRLTIKSDPEAEGEETAIAFFGARLLRRLTGLETCCTVGGMMARATRALFSIALTSWLCIADSRFAAPNPAVTRTELARLKEQYAADPERYWWLHRDIGLKYVELSDNYNAIVHLEKARSLFATRKPEENVGYFLYWLAIAYYREGVDREAIRVALDVLARPGPGTPVADTRKLLVDARIAEGDRSLLLLDTRGAVSSYRLAARELAKSAGSGFEGELGVRLYAFARPPGPKSGSRRPVALTGAVFFCSVRGGAAVEALHKLRARSAGYVFRHFLQTASSGGLDVRLRFYDTPCLIERVLKRGDGVTFPMIEGSSTETELRAAFAESLATADFIVLSHAGFPGSHGSASYHYRFPTPSGRAPGRPRIDWNGPSASALIHEFHHTIASAYYPSLGEAHRFLNPPRAGTTGGRVAPCTDEDTACLRTRPTWIRGNSEIDYYVGLYEQMPRLGGWERMGRLREIFAEQLGERVSSEWD